MSTVGYLAGSPDYLAWGDETATELTVWRISTGALDRYTIRDQRHYFQFLTLAGQFLLWFNGATSSVLDLTTANGFDVNGTVAGSPELIATAEATTRDSAKNASVSSRISHIAIRSAPAIVNCRP